MESGASFGSRIEAAHVCMPCSQAGSCPLLLAKGACAAVCCCSPSVPASRARIALRGPSLTAAAVGRGGPAQVEELSAVAARFRETLEENRRLYNEVQDLKGNIRVFCRVRPLGATGDASPSARACMSDAAPCKGLASSRHAGLVRWSAHGGLPP